MLSVPHALPSPLPPISPYHPAVSTRASPTARAIEKLNIKEECRGKMFNRYGNFDIIVGPFLAHFSAPHYPARAVGYDL